MLFNERDIMLKLNGPFVNKLYKCFQTPKYFHFLLEFLPGGDLYSHISKQHKLTESEAKF